MWFPHTSRDSSCIRSVWWSKQNIPTTLYGCVIYMICHVHITYHMIHYEWYQWIRWDDELCIYGISKNFGIYNKGLVHCTWSLLFLSTYCRYVVHGMLYWCTHYYVVDVQSSRMRQKSQRTCLYVHIFDRSATISYFVVHL